MEVYLLPLGRSRYELYCETPDDDSPDEAVESQPPGIARRVRDWFRTSLQTLEREHLQRDAAQESEGSRRGWLVRVRLRVGRWVAERVAEQRLLWRLQARTTATLLFPQDLAQEAAEALMRRSLRRDLDQHWFWLVIDGVAFVLSALLTLIPGPNLVAYYFAFRLVGHYFSIRGARQGLDRIRWAFEPSADLADLRPALELGRRDRERLVADIASRLRLEHLARFFKRTAVPGA